MNNYTPKPNSGSLWTNSYKKQDNHPDMRGDVYLDRSLLRRLLDNTSDDLIKVSISSWSRTTNNGRDYMSLSISEPYEKPQAQAYQPTKKQPSLPPQDDEEIPF